jgi:hypothetical protein
MIAILSLTLVLAAGCSDKEGEDSTTGPVLAPTASDLLGLKDGHLLEYLVTDTVVTWVPYKIFQDTGTQVIRITGADDDWVIRNDTVPIINLRISAPLVLHNGYWRKLSESNAVVYFSTPAVMLDQSAGTGKVWKGYVGRYTADTGTFTWPFFVGYFGFHFEKKFVGTEQVLTPAWGGMTYRYDVRLFLGPNDVEPSATVTEFYAPKIGLVRQEFRAPGYKRILSLRDYQ